MRRAGLSLLLLAAALPGQAWRDLNPGIALPRRRRPHPTVLLPAGEDLHLFWLAGRGGRGSLLYARFHGGRWSPPQAVCPARRAVPPAAFRLGEELHVLLAGRRPVHARRTPQGWQRLRPPLPGPLLRAAAAPAPRGAPCLLLVRPRRRVARHPRPGALTEALGKAYLQRPAKDADRPRALDPGSPYGVGRVALAVDPTGVPHVLLERRRGPTASPTIDYVSPARPKRIVRVSREPGRAPALVAPSTHELVAFWEDRRGVVTAVYDGRRWLPPRVLLPRGREPRARVGRGGRLHVVAWAGRRCVYLERGPRGWSPPLDLGPAAGPGWPAETPRGILHVVWEAPGRFAHRSRTPPTSRGSRPPRS